ncbi:hypothetical protein KGF57_000992 [Candida theae]|uniref:Uncharacterized protein n=1 Tax=Candida theae TaxID=1198502 RepID=A0AAD5BHW7_9ASCO|nr:uncharacterized protein KGF57_000992 [Candida theae]KAI5964500.1 hypothetical protein KGF57_000992 [Candida theae]
MALSSKELLEKQEYLKSSNYILYKLNCWYYLYYYSTPLPYSTLGESIIFNGVIMSLTLLFMYYTVWILPLKLIQSGENLYYYLTGHTISFDVLQAINTVLHLNGENSTFVINQWSDLPKIIRI